MDLVDATWTGILPFIAIGFAAQIVDGALGMAFGAIANTLLVGFMGLPPAQASYRVHVIKIFTTGVSGLSHAIHRNVDKRLFLTIAIPGTIGGMIGAYGLAQVDGEAIKPFIFGYLSLLGVVLIIKGIHGNFTTNVPKAVVPLGLAGGVLDAVGGGGWGPVVSSGLMIQGTEPRKAIGSVNSAEFFVAIAISGTFLGQFGIERLAGATLGLLIGGILAAPFGAIIAKRLPTSVMLVVVGSVLSATTIYWLYTSVIAPS